MVARFSVEVTRLTEYTVGRRDAGEAALRLEL